MDILQQHKNINAVFYEGGSLRARKENPWRSPSKGFALDRLYLINEGQCAFRINNKEFVGIPGQMFFIPAGTQCSYSSDSLKMDYIFFEIIPHDLDLISLLDIPFCVNAGLNGEAAQLFRQILECKNQETIRSVFQLKSALYSLLVEYIRLSGAAPTRLYYGKDSKSEFLINHIQRNLINDLSNDRLAKLMHMEPHSYIRYFKRITGSTPSNYILKLRLSTAKNLLEKTELPISEIMQKVGISDPSYFSKIFKKHYGQSPKIYRQMYRKEKQTAKSPVE